ncbi:TylF/MycF family methyltransferase [Micromonospora sp. NPDC048871]|uniref:TylF/MycF family methyltransferase n=1 Tax=unclassified Micromonospora TaxID=2617518 RepID=UPI002E0D3FE6|nr:TylF/MycF family methyltransferase [Micromonospora sp. NBC_01739]
MASDTTLYLDLLKKVLTNVIYRDAAQEASWFYQGPGYHEHSRVNGEDWPSVAHTMIGLKRLDNLQSCIERVLADGVAGDLIETGVWRGGASIFARAVLHAHEVKDRRVWVADSFEGMPVTDESSHPDDRDLALHQYNSQLAVSLDEVKRNFESYGLLDEQVVFLKGWFRDTLPTAPIDQLAVLRLDGDLYESTRDALVNLYPKLSPGGFVIIDDYVIPACRLATTEFRDQHGITAELVTIDDSSVYWRRES